jgi:hypothetical protein
MIEVISNLTGYLGLISGVTKDALLYARRSDVPLEARNVNLLMMAIFPYLYRSASSVDRRAFANTDAFRTYAHCYTLISRCDDILDLKGSEKITPSELMSDSINLNLLTEITRLINKSPSSEIAKKQYLKQFEEFMGQECELHAQFKATGKLHDLSSIKEHKEATCGLNAQMLAKMFRLFSPDIKELTAINAEKFIVSTLLYCQVYDDVGDYLIDREANTANYLSATLHANPDERKAFLNEIKSGITNVKKLRFFAPSSFSIVDVIAQEYLSAIPNSLSKLQSQVVLAKNILGGKLTKPKR